MRTRERMPGGRGHAAPPGPAFPAPVEPPALATPRRARDTASSPRARWPLVRDGLAVLLLVLGVLFAIVVFLPAEGRVAGPLHDWIGLFLGQATFLLPLGLIVAGACMLLHSLAPDTPLPMARLFGVTLVAVGALPTLHLVGLPPGGSLARAEAKAGAGFVGHWMSSGLLEWFGGPMTVVVLAAALLVGTLLVFDLTITQAARWTYLGSWLSVRLLGRGARGMYRRRGVVHRVGRQLPRAAQPLRSLARGRHVPRASFASLRRHAQPRPRGAATLLNARSLRPPAQDGGEPAWTGAAPTSRAPDRPPATERPTPATGLAPYARPAASPGPAASALPTRPAPRTEYADPAGTAATRTAGTLDLALGQDVAGTVVADLARMPHLLVAGAPQSALYPWLTTALTALTQRHTPDALRLVLLDAKPAYLPALAELPDVQTLADDAAGALATIVAEMERRYRLFGAHGVRNLDGYNQRARDLADDDQPPLPYLVVVVADLADVLAADPDGTEQSLCRLAQLARATGIHLVVATTQPRVEVLSGTLRANFATRLAFAVTSQTESRVILDQAGAETLDGDDALYLAADAMKPTRLRVDLSAPAADAPPDARPAPTPRTGSANALPEVDDVDEETYAEAVELAETLGRLTVSLLQRRLGLDAAQAERLLDQLVSAGIADP